MASILYGRKAKPFEFKSTTPKPITFDKKTILKPNAKRTFEQTVLSDSDEDECIDVSKHNQDRKSTETDVAEEGYKAQLQEKLKAMRAAAAEPDHDEPTIVHLDSSSVRVDASFDKAALELKNKILLTKRTRSTDSSSSNSQSTQPYVVNLDEEPEFIAPIVARGSARVVTAPSRNESDGLSIDQLQQLAGSASSSSSRAAAASGRGAPPGAARAVCLLRTRLNGLHEHKWKVAFDDPFFKVCGFVP